MLCVGLNVDWYAAHLHSAGCTSAFARATDTKRTSAHYIYECVWCIWIRANPKDMSANCDFCMVELHSIRSVVIALYICDSSKRQRQQPITPYLIALHIEYISICVLSLSLSLCSAWRLFFFNCRLVALFFFYCLLLFVQRYWTRQNVGWFECNETNAQWMCVHLSGLHTGDVRNTHIFVDATFLLSICRTMYPNMGQSNILIGRYRMSLWWCSMFPCKIVIGWVNHLEYNLVLPKAAMHINDKSSDSSSILLH